MRLTGMEARDILAMGVVKGRVLTPHDPTRSITYDANRRPSGALSNI